MKKIDWTNHVIEFITVVIGILLAFGLNAFYENKKEATIVDQQLEGIKQELESNLEEIEEKLEYHQGLLMQLRNNPLEVTLQLKSAELKKTAWSIAENHAFKKHLEYGIYKELLDIYDIQDKLEQHTDHISELMSYLNVIGPFHQATIIAGGGKEFINAEVRTYIRQGWIPIFEDTVSWEIELKQLYKQILKKL